jgi:hypothetical protein
MTLDLATLPADLLEVSPDRDHATQPEKDPACELEPADTSLAASSAASLLQEIAQELAVLQQTPEFAPASYPNDHFIHALYGGFMGMPDLPGALLRDTLWDSFIDAYTHPELSHHFAHIVFPAA